MILKEGNLVCQVQVPRVVDQKTVMVACGKKYVYDLAKPSTSGALKHLTCEHGYSKDGAPNVKQAQLKVGDDGTPQLDVVVP